VALNAGDGEAPLIGALGDLIEDLVVELGGPIRPRTDTGAVITRRRGGSAANVAVAAVLAGGRGRFLGNVGGDDLADSLLARLGSVGVEPVVSRVGRAGTVIAVIDAEGERSLLTDRGSSGDLAEIPPGALDGLAALHVPAYAFAVEPLGATAASALAVAREVGILTSVDTSAVPVIEGMGPGGFRRMLVGLTPDVVLCNEDEARALGVDGPLAGVGLTIVKRGARPALLLREGFAVEEVPARAVAEVADTTGAGDAFAAGVLVGLCSGLGPRESVEAGHVMGAAAVAVTGALQGTEYIAGPG